MDVFDAMKREMIDIHMHLIPGVDDGAEDSLMALMMIMHAGDQGIRAIFATPHSSAFDQMPEATNHRYRQLCIQAAPIFPDLRLYPGCEVYCEANNMEQIVDALNSGQYPTMNRTNYVLAEFSQWVMPERTEPCLEALVKAGYIPIIAHLERYQYLRDNLELVDRFRALGALVQVNVYSLFDETDDSIRNWARQLVLKQKVDFLGTDAHRTYHRPPSAERGLSWLYENVSPAYADAVSWGNAQNLLCR